MYNLYNEEDPVVVYEITISWHLHINICYIVMGFTNKFTKEHSPFLNSVSSSAVQEILCFVSNPDICYVFATDHYFSLS